MWPDQRTHVFVRGARCRPYEKPTPSADHSRESPTRVTYVKAPGTNCKRTGHLRTPSMGDDGEKLGPSRTPLLESSYHVCHFRAKLPSKIIGG